MNFKTYRAYVMNKKKQEKKKLIIEVDNVQQAKQLLTTKHFDVKNVNELIFVNPEGEILATFDVRKITLF